MQRTANTQTMLSDHSMLYILKCKRNASLSKMVVPSFSYKNSASDNEIAKYHYLPCIQHQNQTTVSYGWRAAKRNVSQPPFLKSQSSKIVPILRKKHFKPISVFESKRIDKIKSGTSMVCQLSFCQNDIFNFLRNWPFLSKRILIIENF